MTRAIHPPRCLLILLATATILMLAPEAARSRTWYITVDGLGDAPTIQAGIDSAGVGDLVLVGAGHYTWTNQGAAGASMLQLKPGIELRSESGSLETLVDSQHTGRVVHCNGVDDVTIVGFTFQGGQLGDEPAGPEESERFQTASPPLIHSGAGVWCINSNDIVFSNCIVTDCESADGPGGGVHVQSCSPTFLDCTIAGNRSADKGGAFYLMPSASPTLINCTIADNEATQGGGGIFAGTGSNPLIQNCIISGSVAGEGVACSGGSPTFECCVIFGNAGGDGLCGVDAGGNAVVDPLFCGVENPEIPYALDVDSPCLPFAPPNDGCDLIGAWAIGCPAAGVEDPYGADRLESAAIRLLAVPSPFRSQVRFSVEGSEFQHSGAGLPHVLRLVDSGGRTVRTFSLGPNQSTVDWDGRDTAGRVTPRGTYFAHLTDGSRSAGVRLVKLGH